MIADILNQIIHVQYYIPTLKNIFFIIKLFSTYPNLSVQ